ncbi:hypothetical protein PHLCEN_2v828 [Hermanssonia centrifuga]|uniref:DNA polymerase delta subunit 3 n=1 Tax=Hermanssonia centrifuga TaxID=98765 RepID=A0A2R6S4Y7_9APHY|nr:hypothetical protein PHLCEN_2v828 [Hermanssonia centrifuga]
MTSKITDYLTKQIFIEKNVVTFRLLSRQFNVHVNESKNALATFYATNATSDERAYATYLLSGEVPLVSKLGSKQNGGPAAGNEDYIDEDEVMEDVNEQMDDLEEVVPQTKMTLAGEQDLERAKSTYSRIYSEYIYCLSPSPVHDAGLICTSSDQVYAADAKLKPDVAASLGRIIGSHVHMGKKQNLVASTYKGKEPAVRVATPVVQAKEKTNEETKRKELLKEKVPAPKKEEKEPLSIKPKPTGKLDWSKAKPRGKAEEKEPQVKEKPSVADKKPKEEIKEEEEKVQPEKKGLSLKPKASGSKDTIAQVLAFKVKEEKPTKPRDSSNLEVKRGQKRKSALPADTESEEESPPSRGKSITPPIERMSGLRLKRKTVISDSEDEDEKPKPQPKLKAKAKSKIPVEIESDNEKSLRAMMDIDDEQVIKASRSRIVRAAETSETEPDDEPQTETQTEDADMMDDSDPAPKPQPRKRKQKKAIPVGKNGLKKKRIVSSRNKLDEKGYMVTEDYSEYESVEEEEPAEEVPKTKKSVAKAKETKSEESKPIKAAPRKSKSSSTEKPKRTGSGKGSQGSLMNFFK